jgi:hypothetical protein
MSDGPPNPGILARRERAPMLAFTSLATGSVLRDVGDDTTTKELFRASTASLEIVDSAFEQTSSCAEDCHLLRLLLAVKEDIDFHISARMQQPNAVESQ